MPALSSGVITDAILKAFEDSGMPAALLSKSTKNPRQFVIATSTGPLEVWVYAWTLTHGGRSTLPFEYRVQKTGVASPLPLNANGPTVLVGFEPNREAFAGFDLVRHKLFTPGSPSAQIDIRAVDRALTDGLSFDKKANNEIAIGIRSDLFAGYVLSARELHRHGSGAAMYKALASIVTTPSGQPPSISSLSGPRKRIAITISKLVRDARFRVTVLAAYDHRCAVTRMQLKLVDAAHILPVGIPGSTDAVSNGMCLSPTYHRAYDNGLIYLDKTFRMILNTKKFSELSALGLAAGFTAFSGDLGKPIHLPANHQQRPDKSFIEKANQARGIH
jgi:putative restriction endonuclease